MATTTKSFTKAQSQRRWFVVDLKGQVLGRVASQIAKVLRGKNKPLFTPHDDGGDFVVAINARDIRLTGNKLSDKMYHHYTNHIGGIKSYAADKLMARRPEALIERAVQGMMPKTALGKRQLKKFHVYAGTEHPHAAQQPELLKFEL